VDNEIVIRARDLRKVYRLYAKPGHRILDLFGLLRAGGAYTEHAALEELSLDIRRGEKVAVIGANGAGKSTFLKLVTGVTEPTSGTLDVHGKVHALLQIGTGFHPDFTGRQNVYAYLAQLGIAGGRAEQLCAEIIDFAELESYIDQPVKTYSTGMGVRLMFSTSTAITPDLLVLDEVLGVGDAYFAHKSFERMRELCEGQGTTLLLVTHDIYSATKLCPRVIWIHRGRVLMDGEAATVVKAYEDSIRQQEEQRLRARKQQRLRALEAAGAAKTVTSHVLLEIQARNNEPQPCPVYFSRVQLTDGVNAVAELPLAAGSARDGSHLELETSCWGEPKEIDGRPTRPMLNYGTPFHKVAGVLAVPATMDVDSLRVHVDYWSEAPCQLRLRAYLDGRERDLGALPPVSGHWGSADAPLAASASAELTSGISLTGRHGTGAISVLDVRTLDAEGRETHYFRHGDAFTLQVHYQINKPDLKERAQVLIAIHRDGITDTCRIWTRELEFDAVTRRRGIAQLHLPRMFLASGTFTITVMVAQEGYYDRAQSRYFSLNPEVYTCLSRVTEIVVTDAGIVGSGTGVVADGEWRVLDESPAPLTTAAGLESAREQGYTGSTQVYGE
jgi:lipopolysaccharide transport system ATP-binding protein